MRIDQLAVGFRDRYLGYDDLTRQVTAWQQAFPEVVRLQSLTRTREGREVWLLTIGREPDRIRPAAWVDGNIHASELCGSSVALGIAEDAIRAHVEPSSPLRDLPPHVADILRDDVLLYVLPRLCPDGAERVLTTGAFVRSNPRDERITREPRWRHHDIDGDGVARLMRRLDPAGDFVASAEIPGLLLPRRIEDGPPYYALYPEGTIEDFDGVHVPAPSIMSDNETDMNRNFPYGWQPEPHQLGAGAFAASEPESRAVTEFAVRHPNIFAWLSLHTFGGVYIRPCGDKPDKKMEPGDLALFRQIEEWGTRFSGYPSVSGFEEFTYEPDKPLCGDLASFAYVQRGAAGFVCELWDFFAQAGLQVLRPFVWNYQRRTREDCVAIARWDREHNRGRIVGAWRPFDHPQLGPVEIGGYDPRIGVWNPPPERLGEVCDAQAKVFLRLAALAPRLRLEGVTAERLERGLTRVSAVVENHGYLPTYFLASSKAMPFNEPLEADISIGPGVSLAAGEARQRLGHLDGWGGYDKWASPILARSSGGPFRRRLQWVVRGEGRVTLSVTGQRVGRVEATVQVG